MTTDDHIAAIKEHLKAIEAEKQPKKEPRKTKKQKRYLVIPVKYSDRFELLAEIRACAERTENTDFSFLKFMIGETRYKVGRMYGQIEELIRSGKIITVNEG